MKVTIEKMSSINPGARNDELPSMEGRDKLYCRSSGTWLAYCNHDNSLQIAEENVDTLRLEGSPTGEESHIHCHTP